VLGDSGACVVLTSRARRELLPDDAPRAWVLDDASEAPAAAAAGASPELCQRDLAYVIYTSGSTGEPKGVAVEHGHLAALVAWHCRAWRVTSGDRVPHLAGQAFAASVWELWPHLCAGACVLLPDDETRVDPERLRDFFVDRGVTLAFAPTPVAQALVSLEWPASMPLRALLTGGDRLTASPPSRLPFALINNYGPTETTVLATSGRVQADDDASALAPSIGRPIDNTQVYVLDARLEPVAPGLPGEICIGGAGVARGYLGRPDWTAARFVPDPFSTTPGARLYRSNDIGRHRADGSLEFLGRLDQQVKLRGFRIELGEIEAALDRHPRVAAAAVTARPGGDDRDRRLVAYVVGRGGDAVFPAELRAHLLERLPAYMVPETFVPLETLPLTPSGKLDRRALPEPPADIQARADRTSASPQTATEAALAALWSELLGVPRVGRHDDFFALGGHSLAATQLLARLRAAWRLELPLRALFEAPTLAGFARRLEAAQGSGREDAAPALARVARDGPIPQSYFQESLWLFEELSPGTATYTLSRSARLRGPLDVAALEAALDALVARHEVLRTTYAALDGQPVQTVRAHTAFDLALEDLTALPAAEREAWARRRAQAEATRPFDLARAPLARALLLRLAEQEHIFVFSLHHIACDLTSDGVLLAELVELYTARVAGRPQRLEPLAWQYADFAAWQRRALRGAALERELEHWRARLHGLSGAPLELPYDFPRPAEPRFTAGTASFRVEGQVAVRLRDLGRREGATTFMVLLAAFQALLQRWTGQDDVVTGTAVTNRSHAEMEGVVGYFDNLLVLRSDAAGDPSFVDFLRRVRETALEAFAHDRLPFEWLVQALRPERGARAPWLQAAFVFLLGDGNPLRGLAGLEVEPEAADSGGAKFELTFALRDAGDGFAGEVEYDAELFAPASIEALVRRFQHLLESAAEDPERPLSLLRLWDASERARVLEQWNATGLVPARPALVHERLLEAAAAFGGRTAVVAEDGVLDYVGFGERVLRLARHLRGLGVRPGVNVGVCLERSLDLAVTLPAVLAAGGAYVPLDASYPTERLAFMLRDSRAPLLVTTSGLEALLQGCDQTRLLLDRDAARIAAEEARPLPPSARPDDLCYVLYTSGSTGLPKGVAVTHRAVVNLLESMARRPGLAAEDVVASVSSASFDIFEMELYLPLLSGARLVLLPARLARDGQELLHALRRHGATFLQATPATFRLLLAAGYDGHPRLRLISGGEALAPELARQLLPLARELWNQYGPTETAIYSTQQRVESATHATVPIGAPLANTRASVVDAWLRPLPPGVPGELLIGGDGVARGYFGRPDLTAERFLPDPWAGVPGARLFRTGDRARWQPEGTLEYLGRLDQQAKLRGYRIELGEIEAVLGGHPAVEHAVVSLRGQGDDRRLVAYLVARAGATADQAELRALVQRRLPEFMRPSAYVDLERLPLSPNGKLDRRALPEPERAGSRAPRAPRDEHERRLARVWERVLGGGPAGLDDDFWERGGHSLKAVELQAALRAEFGRTLPLAVLVQHPTVAQMAAALAGAEPAGSTGVVRLRAGGTRAPLWALHPVSGDVLCYADVVRDLGPDQPVWALEASETHAGATSLEDLARRYLSDVRAAQPHGPYHLLGFSFGGLLAFELARQLAQAGETVALLALVDALPPAAQPGLRDVTSSWASLLEDIEGLLDTRLDLDPAGLERATDDEALARLHAAIVASARAPQGVGFEELRARVMAYRRHLDLLRRYDPRPFACRSLFVSGEDAARATRGDPAAPWRALIGPDLEHATLPAAHHDLLRGEHATRVAAWLATALAAAGDTRAR
jgi:amino acid adenylation domain-containing protein